MREVVKCQNCKIIWVRVTSWGTVLEATEDLMYNCPRCGSNYCKSHEEVTTRGNKKERHNWEWQKPQEGMRRCSKCGKVSTIKSHSTLGGCIRKLE